MAKPLTKTDTRLQMKHVLGKLLKAEHHHSKKLEALDGTTTMLVRTANCLQNDLIDTIGQLADRSVGQLMAIPNFGYTCLFDLLCHLVDFLETDYPSIRAEVEAVQPFKTEAAEKARNENLNKSKAVYDLRQTGMTYEAIGRTIGVSKSRVQQRVKFYERYLKAQARTAA